MTLRHRQAHLSNKAEVTGRPLSRTTSTGSSVVLRRWTPARFEVWAFGTATSTGSTGCKSRPCNQPAVEPEKTVSGRRRVTAISLSSSCMAGRGATRRRVEHPRPRRNLACKDLSAVSARKRPMSPRRYELSARKAIKTGGVRARWWATRDSNPDGLPHTPLKRARLPVPPAAQLQPVDITRWYPRQDSNSQPPDPKSGALSIELRGRSPIVGGAQPTA
jgi:hypothetical protein